MAKKQPIDKCKLCGLVKELCDSHYMPKRVYAFLRADKLKNPNPIMPVKGKLTQISDQYRGYVLCRDCEDILNKNGEKWVLANIPHSEDAPFPLRDALGPVQPIVIIEPYLNLHNVSRVAAFDMGQLLHFGMGIFWRGAAHRWKSSKGEEAPAVDLGHHQESIRKFVLGTGSFPGDVVLTIDISPYKRVHYVMYPVLESNVKECRRYWFYIPGLFFSLFLGPGVPDVFRRLSAKNGLLALNRRTADSVANYTREGLRSLVLEPKMQEVLKEIAKIRPKPPS